VGTEVLLDDHVNRFLITISVPWWGRILVTHWLFAPWLVRGSLAWSRAFRLLDRRNLEEGLQLLAHPFSWRVAGSGQPRRRTTAVARFWEAHLKIGVSSSSS
jgi:hypothetical protein